MNRFAVVLFICFFALTTSSAQRKMGKEVTLTGEIIGLQCYVSGAMGKATGPDHKQCATDCAKGGIPLALLEEKTKTVYMCGQTKSAMKGANELLMPYIADKVRVSGTLVEKGGMKMVLISKMRRVEE